MKKVLLLAAAMFATSTAFADYYVIGSDVNGASWALADANAKMTETSTGIYEWNGTSLGSGFKINDGTWDNGDANIGSNGSAIKLDTPYEYNASSDSGDIQFDNFTTVQNPKVVLNTNNKTITLTGNAGEFNPFEADYYMIGNNVNGLGWDYLKAESSKFENKGNGIFVWKGEVLGSGFKINDGTWGPIDIGGTDGSPVVLGVPYYYTNKGANFALEYAQITEPVVTLDLNEATVTVEGNAGGSLSWYIPGFNESEKVLDENSKMESIGNGQYKKEVYLVITAGTFKVATDGWGTQFGTNMPEDNYILAPDMLELVLDAVGSEGDVPYELTEGTWTAVWDENEQTITFVNGTVEGGGEGAVEVVLGEDSKAVYYNLHGQKVANPDKGIYVKVVNGKAVKVVK